MEKLQLYYPLKGWLQTQSFGEVANLQYYLDNGLTFVGHNGIDAWAPHGTPIRAAHDGMCHVEVDNKGGWGVTVTTTKKFAYKTSGAYYKTIYWHMVANNVPVTDGQMVKAGDVIGYVNSTGLSTGDHLHFGCKALDDNGDTLDYYNGYLGAIDPSQFFNGLYAEDIGKPPKPEVFKYNLQRGDSGVEVLRLQKFLVGYNYLKESEMFPSYGPRTQLAVFRFQQDFGVPLTFQERNVAYFQGRYWGPKSRKVANDLSV